MPSPMPPPRPVRMPAVRPDELDVLRVMTWNVKDMHGDPLAVHRVIAAARPDVLCLQEAPRLVLSRLQLTRIAQLSGLRLGDGGRLGAGAAILLGPRTRAEQVRCHRLPVAGWLTRPRGFVRALLWLPGTEPVMVTSMHLGLDPMQRADHVDRMLRGLIDDVPAILAGDLNERPNGPSWRTLSNWAIDPAPGAPNTFSAKRPRARIDAVLVDPRLEVVGYGDPEGVDEEDVQKASDHRPVIARVRLPRIGRL